MREKRELATKPYQVTDTARSDERFVAKIYILQQKAGFAEASNMSLKLIPTEEADKNGFSQNGGAKKHFNPGNKIKGSKNEKDGGLKQICLRLVHFINRGSKFTHQQIDDLIMGMQRSVLALQKKKQEVMRRKFKK